MSKKTVAEIAHDFRIFCEQTAAMRGFFVIEKTDLINELDEIQKGVQNKTHSAELFAFSQMLKELHNGVYTPLRNFARRAFMIEYGLNPYGQEWRKYDFEAEVEKHK